MHEERLDAWQGSAWPARCIPGILQPPQRLIYSSNLEDNSLAIGERGQEISAVVMARGLGRMGLGCRAVPYQKGVGERLDSGSYVFPRLEPCLKFWQVRCRVFIFPLGEGRLPEDCLSRGIDRNPFLFAFQYYFPTLQSAYGYPWERRSLFTLEHILD